MGDSDSYSWVWVLLIIFFLFNPFNKWDKVWVENYYCKNGYVEDKCIDKAQHWSTVVYQINKDKQVAIQSIEGAAPQTFNKCSVNNSNNWQCTFDDDSGTFGMTDGKYMENPTNNIIHGVGHTTWLMHMWDVMRG